MTHHVVCGQENIAGVTVPVFQELSFEEIQYDVADYPLWVDTAAVRLREIARLDALEKDPPPPGGASGAGAALHGPAGEPV